MYKLPKQAGYKMENQYSNIVCYPDDAALVARNDFQKLVHEFNHLNVVLNIGKIKALLPQMRVCLM